MFKNNFLGFSYGDCILNEKNYYCYCWFVSRLKNIRYIYEENLEFMGFTQNVFLLHLLHLSQLLLYEQSPRARWRPVGLLPSPVFLVFMWVFSLSALQFSSHSPNTPWLQHLTAVFKWGHVYLFVRREAVLRRAAVHCGFNLPGDAVKWWRQTWYSPRSLLV